MTILEVITSQSGSKITPQRSQEKVIENTKTIRQTYELGELNGNDIKIGRLGEGSKWNRRNSSAERCGSLVEVIKESMEEFSPSKGREARMKN
jgi:hypothetical protein